MSNVKILKRKTYKKFKIDINNDKISPNQKVCVKCTICDEKFIREYKRAYQPHACLHKHKSVYENGAVRLEAKLLEASGMMPTRTRITDAGYDLYSIVDAIVPAHGAMNIATGIAISAPEGYYYTIDGRSGLAMQGIIPFRGIIDATYCGELMVALLNFSDNEYKVHKKDRIAQIILHKIIDHDIILIKKFSDEYNIRGVDGFGSSGR